LVGSSEVGRGVLTAVGGRVPMGAVGGKLPGACVELPIKTHDTEANMSKITAKYTRFI